MLRTPEPRFLHTIALCFFTSACGTASPDDGALDSNAEPSLGAASQALTPKADSFGWVYFDGTRVQSAHSFNPSGLTDTVSRPRLGHYRVLLKGTGENTFRRANVQVSVVEKLGFSAASCAVTQNTYDFESPDIEVLITCSDTSGDPKDAAFYLSAFVENSSAPNAVPTPGIFYGEVINIYDGSCRLHLLQDRPDGTCLPGATGRYRLHLVGPMEAGGTVQLTSKTEEHYCNVENWFPQGDGTNINVSCFGPDGTPAVTNFYVQYRLVAQQKQGGFVWANNPTSSSYIPLPTYNDRKPTCFTAPEHDIAVRRSVPSTAGEYLVTYPELGDVDGPAFVHTTAYGLTSNFCRLSGPAFVPGDAVHARRAKVNCYNTSGGRADTKFTQLLEVGADPLCVY